MSRNDAILIVEDSDDDYYATARILGKCGRFSLKRCSQGTEVLEHLSQDSSNRPSLILLDLNLPGKRDGRSVLTELKADARFRRIPVVIMTTSANPTDVRHCFDHGAAGYMVKPVNLDKFVESIEGMVKYWFEIMTLPAKVKGSI
jgi:CheY-like chemotaxis protein